MADHTKPTPEELEANTQKAIDELDKLEEKEEVKEEEVITPNEDEETLPEPEVEEEEPEPSDEVEEEVEIEAKPEKKEPDYKKKFSESAKESQKLYAKNRVMDQALDEAEALPEPTDEDLQSEYSNWELMTEDEKRINREILINKRFRQVLQQGRERGRKIENWEKSVAEFLDDPQTFLDTPELEGKEQPFQDYATREEHNSIPFKTLVGSFLHEQSKIVKPKHKGKMFETGTGGPNDRPKPKSDILSVEESRTLKDSNYKLYAEKLKAGKIATE